MTTTAPTTTPIAEVPSAEVPSAATPIAATPIADVPSAATPIADVRLRERVTVEGTITSLLVRPLADVPTVEIRVSDSTGTLPVVFLGRRKVPGLHLGTRLALTGVVGSRGRCLVAINPDYELLVD